MAAHDDADERAAVFDGRFDARSFNNLQAQKAEILHNTNNDVIAVQLTPWLSLRNGARAVEFYKSAFDAREVYRVENSAGEVVSQLSIEGAAFWVSDESPEHGNFSPETLGGGSVKMLLTVSNPDSMFARAVAAGAREVSPVQEGHGWRVGRVVDPYGHHWEIGKPLRRD